MEQRQQQFSLWYFDVAGIDEAKAELQEIVYFLKTRHVAAPGSPPTQGHTRRPAGNGQDAPGPCCG